MGDFQKKNVKPTNREYSLDPDSFIYCANRNCPCWHTGLCRVYPGPDMATICRRCNTPFPKKPNGNTYGFDHRIALRKGKPKSGSGKANGSNGRTNGGNRPPATQRQQGNSELQQLTALVTTLATNVQKLQATQNNRNHHPSENASPGGGGRVAGDRAQGQRWGAGTSGRQTGESSQGDRPLTRPQTPISPETVPPDFGGEMDSTEPSQLAAHLAASQNIPPHIAATMAEMVLQNQLPISPPPQKYTAIFQSFSNAHNAANAAVLKARASLELANVAHRAAADACAEALASARKASEELAAAKLRAQATWDELQANSKNAKAQTAQTASDSTHERIKAARKLLEGINNPELHQIVGNLKEVEAAASPDASMDGAGIAVELSSVAGLSATDQNVQDDLCPYGTDYAARTGHIVSPILPNNHSSESKRDHEGSSGDEHRFTQARLGVVSLQAHRLEMAKLENAASLELTDGAAGVLVCKPADAEVGRNRSRSPSARKSEEPQLES